MAEKVETPSADIEELQRRVRKLEGKKLSLEAQLSMQEEANRQLRIRVERLTGKPYEVDMTIDQTTRSAFERKTSSG
jgi:predicted ribosome quality control (RQC) complex YloA/Tae2 family protein